jgi:hypothetical protein
VGWLRIVVVMFDMVNLDSDYDMRKNRTVQSVMAIVSSFYIICIGYKYKGLRVLLR